MILKALRFSIIITAGCTQIKKDQTNPLSGKDTGIFSVNKYFDSSSSPKESTLMNVYSSPPSPPQLADSIIDFAKQLIGTPYMYASAKPQTGFDCSGFIYYVFNNFKIAVPRSSIDFKDFGKSIALANSKKGDLILFTGTDSTIKIIGHIGIVIRTEGGKIDFIHSTSGKAHGVTISELDQYYQKRFVRVLRILPE